MKIIIPMVGTGKRFLDAGYQIPKPMIEVDGKPMIYHLVDMFSAEDNFVFVCNQDHLRTTGMETVLRGTAKNVKILGMTPHKFGPVHSIRAVFDEIEDGEPLIVNYCDFAAYWDYEDFKKIVAENGCDAAVTAYKGFHPHLLGPNLYASMRVGENNWMLECREKHSFTENKMDSFQQSGTFYFSEGSIMKKYFDRVVERGAKVNGEYYISIATQLMAEDGLKIYVYPLEHFLQWGTPQDMEEYAAWSRYFASSNGKPANADKRVEEYWDSFFKKCKWHPYGKGVGK